jgi:hypothetical protein
MSDWHDYSEDNVSSCQECKDLHDKYKDEDGQVDDYHQEVPIGETKNNKKRGYDASLSNLARGDKVRFKKGNYGNSQLDNLEVYDEEDNDDNMDNEDNMDNDDNMYNNDNMDNEDNMDNDDNMYNNDNMDNEDNMNNETKNTKYGGRKRRTRRKKTIKKRKTQKRKRTMKKRKSNRKRTNKKRRN